MNKKKRVAALKHRREAKKLEDRRKAERSDRPSLQYTTRITKVLAHAKNGKMK